MKVRTVKTDKIKQGDHMQDVNMWAVAVAPIAAFILSTVYYIAFAKEMARLQGIKASEATKPPEPWKVMSELVRSLALALVVAYLVSAIGITSLGGALLLGLGLWVGFPVVLLTGSVQWDDVKPKLAMLHAGDWLIKLLFVTVLLSLWR